MKTVSVLPTLVTLANGFAGVLAMYKADDGKYYAAAGFILLAMVFDMLDGKVARMAGISSEFGGQLDSLCDAISFCVAPAFLVKVLVENTGPAFYDPRLLTLLTIAFALAGLVRLARYNVEHSSGEGSDAEGDSVASFHGIPTPGAAGVIAALVFMAQDPKALSWYGHIVVVLPFLCPLLGWLMVSEVPYVHFGSTFLKGRRDFGYIFLLIVVAALLALFPEEFCAIGFLVYAFSGPVLLLLGKRREPDEAESV